MQGIPSQPCDHLDQDRKAVSHLSPPAWSLEHLSGGVLRITRVTGKEYKCGAENIAGSVELTASAHHTRESNHQNEPGMLRDSEGRRTSVHQLP